MVKINNWSLAGMSTGIVFAILSLIRYYAIYVDYDKAIAYTLIGIFIFMFAWVYDRIKRMEITLDRMEEYLVDKR